VYRGLGLGVDASNNLTIAAGNGCQHNGIVWIEDDTVTLTTFVPGAPAVNYTVVATHTDVAMFGGAPVEYSIQAGLSSSVASGVVLGWIYYPGGSFSLAADYLVDAPKLLPTVYTPLSVETKPLEIVAPLPRTYTDTAGMGANITYTNVTFDVANFVVYQSMANAAGAPGPETAIQHVQYFMGNYRPSSFDLYVDIDTDPATNLTVQVYDSTQALVTATGSPFTGTGGWARITLNVDRTDGTFTANTPWTLRLTHNLAPGDEIKLSNIIVNFWPYPV
jgi:hypothetical protein